jgi:hypothetical protein
MNVKLFVEIVKSLKDIFTPRNNKKLIPVKVRANNNRLGIK